MIVGGGGGGRGGEGEVFLLADVYYIYISFFSPRLSYLIQRVPVLVPVPTSEAASCIHPITVLLSHISITA